MPRFQLDTVLGLELEVRCVGVENDGTFERSVEVGKIFDQLLVLESSRISEELPRDVSAVGIEFLDNGCGSLDETKQREYTSMRGNGKDGNLRMRVE